MINTIIYDLDGTIVNTKKSIIKSFNLAFKKNKIKTINESFFKKNANRGSEYLIKQRLNKDNIYLLKKINKDFHKFYKINCTKNISCKKGVKFFLSKYKKKYTHIICTNKNTLYANKILQKLKIKNYFSYVIGSDFSPYKKPSINLFKKIKSKKIQKEIILIGDSEIDFKFANNSNLKFILLENGYTNKKKNEISNGFHINNFYKLQKIISLFN